MDNPYQPSIHGGAPPPLSASSATSIGVVQGLAATKPWVRFCAILGFIMTGVMALFGVIMMVGMTFAGMSKAGASEMGMLVVLGAIYLLLAAIYLVPTLRLWKYGTAIMHLMMSGSVTDLDKALEHHRSFWKFVGILMILGTIVSILGFLGGLLAGLATAGGPSTP
ncbi:DUF5362 family protein [Luteolibacter luteus]|uniref:Uncharacterized protein n=1 Tax=Luteolibacter luteus TaxID=2728835 RepID=A0A858RNN3_9BACT|nr:DUF5362 family protein [Luteolibacter luteus]QJE98345.1 hypothetical protein HHL09_22020 [Luteolibacter luteus]